MRYLLIFVNKNSFFSLLFLLFSTAPFFSSAQQFNIKQFDENLNLSSYLLQNQPNIDSLIKTLPKDYKMDSISAFKCYVKDKLNRKIVVYLHIKSLKIVYVELHESQKNFQDLNNYLTNTKNFTYIGSERNCDYLNDKTLSITLCSGMKDGIMIHVSLFEE